MGAPNTRGFVPELDVIRESSSAPQLTRADTPEAFVFRIRNLPYEKSVFSVSVDNDTIVVRTTNKKYFKRLEIPDLKRAGVPLDPSLLTFDVKHNTLVVEYKKPLVIRVAEDQDKKERGTMKSIRMKEEEEKCAQQ